LGKLHGKNKIHQEFLHNLGPKARVWLAKVLYAVFESGKIPKNWKTSNIVEFLKLGKATDDPAS